MIWIFTALLTDDPLCVLTLVSVVLCVPRVKVVLAWPTSDTLMYPSIPVSKAQFAPPIQQFNDVGQAGQVSAWDDDKVSYGQVQH